MTAPFAVMLADAAAGRFPAADGAVDVVGPPDGPADAVIAFTAHHVVAADVVCAEVVAQLPPNDLGAPMKPPLLAWLERRLAAPAGMLDLVLVAPPTAEPARGLVGTDADDHPRVMRARQYRTDVRVFSDRDAHAYVVLGRGLAGRLEIAVEVAPEHRGRGLCRSLARAAASLAPHEPLYAQVSPGNVASVRAFLAAG